MLYPDFNELVAFKDRKLDLVHPSTRSVKSSVSGNHRSPFRGQGLEFDSVREYVFGDDIRSIDWRVTARTGSPHLKLFKEERERQIIICVDMNGYMRFGTRNTFKSIQAARLAALLGWKGMARQDRISACLFGDVPSGIQFFAPKRTSKSFCAMLKTLSQPTEERHEISLDKVLQHVEQTAHTGSLIYLISDFMNLENNFQQQAILSRLSKRCDVVFIAVNDQSDKFLPPVGALGFRDLDSVNIVVNTDSAVGRAAYAAQWAENRKRLNEITRKSKIPILELTTESDLPRDLSLGLKTIAKRKKR